MNERIRQLRKSLDLTLEEFGKALGVGKTAISNIENGKRNLTEQMLKGVCREFNVREEWLRTGNGAMFEEMSRAEKAAQIVGAALGSDDDFILNTFIALGQLSPAEWDLIKSFVDKLKSDT